jgi:hypothetical protein
MLFTVNELVTLLRSAVNVQNEDAEVNDPAFLTMTDEDLTMFLKLGMSKVYPSMEDLTDLPPGSDYPVVLVAKKELYLKLAVVSAPLFDLTADNNNQLKRNQRFQHYMALAENAQQEYEDWVENGGGATVDPNTGIQGITTYDVIRSKNHYSLRNYEHGPVPIVRIKIGEITNESVSFSWQSFNNSHFGKYKVYISDKPIVDIYKEGTQAEDKVLEGATLIMSTMNFRNTHKRVTGLEPEKEYYLAVFSIERNQLYGYKQITFQTPPVLTEEEVDVETLGGDLDG